MTLEDCQKHMVATLDMSAAVTALMVGLCLMYTTREERGDRFIPLLFTSSTQKLELQTDRPQRLWEEDSSVAGMAGSRMESEREPLPRPPKPIPSCAGH